SARVNDVPVVAEARLAARRAAEEEYRRLLYVAMTRAADRLIVCGARGERKPPDGCWYELISTALLPEAVEVPAEVGEGTGQRWQKFTPTASEPALSDMPPSTVLPQPSPPDWLSCPAPAPPPRAARLAPSTAFRAHGPAMPRRRPVAG